LSSYLQKAIYRTKQATMEQMMENFKGCGQEMGHRGWVVEGVGLRLLAS
jgi:hypothetical protein